LDRLVFVIAKEEAWRFKVVADLAGPEKCIRQFALSVKKNAKFRLSPEKIARYTAGIVIQSARTKLVKKRCGERFLCKPKILLHVFSFLLVNTGSCGICYSDRRR
jgi:hypothetical protein